VIIHSTPVKLDSVTHLQSIGFAPVVLRECDEATPRCVSFRFAAAFVPGPIRRDFAGVGDGTGGSIASNWGDPDFGNGIIMLGKTLLLSSLLLVALSLSAAMPPAKEKAKTAQSIAELQLKLEKIMADTHTPGVSVAIVHRDGPEWVAGLGKANVAANAPVTDATLFRIGSTSKAFAFDSEAGERGEAFVDGSGAEARAGDLV
jgi:hypothetical protein